MIGVPARQALVAFAHVAPETGTVVLQDLQELPADVGKSRLERPHPLELGGIVEHPGGDPGQIVGGVLQGMSVG